MRKFDIWIKRDYEFHMIEQGYQTNNKNQNKDMFKRYFFAGIEMEGSEIKYIFDLPYFDSLTLELIKKDDIFSEICEFDITMTNINWEDTKIKKKFSLYDAFVFIDEYARSL
ncbi:TPA: hypothetical protein RPW15_001977 [Campylobacter fetus subsp. venerealis]|uniref:Uncharacterized protein n=1 Tax=Campylobacter fetus subsp. venerealis NCTC 10354 TaxID=983328 RepID=A0AAE6IXZ3_CAMFE|nr:hypothetical protein [Campylobacter fetus]OCS25325.1 hypothetical protein CFVB10_08985 [Campylobacter fetus subsp. venerealis cfvB10]OCS29078.1 hypothetical protein CFVCCUG33900_08225 [Campylobacter fetus subsp. venerealis LMG 6570 = CCUG 33900]AIR80152.1 hypothetical protein CFV97608_0489 [Campylobacter fetus subsp. venerealis 97/608]EAK0836195.1 hypothetical protein [Campylobacter fetus]MBK3487628.1 hypothetical protein [Campylobacter fetus subsp. venerealis]